MPNSNQRYGLLVVLLFVGFHRYGEEIIIDLTYDLTKDFMPPEFMQELTGMVNATGISMERALGVTLLPEIIKAGCSMFGAWGKATAQSRDGALVQLRALDWTTNGPFQVRSPPRSGWRVPKPRPFL